MKTGILIISFFLFIQKTSANDLPSFNVLVRQDKSNRTYITSKKLENLKSDHSFEGDYFKIVEGKTNDPIDFKNLDEELILKAATVYYHLNEARRFWINDIKSTTAEKLPQITVRLNIRNQFDEQGHFANDNRTPQFNNALSVPQGETPHWVPEGRRDKWDKEIWFRPKKYILTKDLGSPGPNPLTVGIRALKNPLLNYFQGQFNNQIVEYFFYPAYVSRPLYEEVIRYAGTYALMNVILSGSKYADSLFLEKYYYLETALVPEIAFHEYAHIVLSENLEMSHSTPVNEGIADYFAAVQSKRRKVYAKVSGHSNAAPKDTREKKKYSHWDEANRNATSDFTLSVLWDVRETLGDEVSDQVIYESRKFLKTESSTISEGLLRALLRACEIKCKSPRRDKLKLYETFMWKGF
jgi:hypothetical protein